MDAHVIDFEKEYCIRKICETLRTHAPEEYVERLLFAVQRRFGLIPRNDDEEQSRRPGA